MSKGRCVGIAAMQDVGDYGLRHGKLSAGKSGGK